MHHIPPTGLHNTAAGAGSTSGSSAASPERAAAAAPRVLLVEDDAVNRILSSLVVQAATGTPPDNACDGEEALEMVCQQPYDLILMDLLMPGMGGIEATRQIRALPSEAARCPIVALSASNHPDDVQRCLAAGMNGHLLKPLQADDLRAVLARWLKPPPQPLR
jgi:CheY-like chemotaxis protein